MRPNIVLIDFENVQPESLDLLKDGPFKVLVFVGAHQAKGRMRFEFAESVQRLGEKAQYVRIEGNGPNALDFHIAYYIGRMAAETPDAYFHVISKDDGFDPLIVHLKSLGVFCKRSESLTDIPLVKPAQAVTPIDKVKLIQERLVAHKAAKPRSIKTLSGTIRSQFGTAIDDSEIEKIIAALAKRGFLVVTGTKISYPADASSS